MVVTPDGAVAGVVDHWDGFRVAARVYTGRRYPLLSLTVHARYHLDLGAVVEDDRHLFCLEVTPAKTAWQTLYGRELDERALVRRKVDAFLWTGGRFAEVEWTEGRRP